MLQIKNPYELVHKTIYSKFLPSLGEWQVESIVKDNLKYNINIQNTKTPDREMIFLDRESLEDPFAEFKKFYRVWGRNKNGEEKSKLIRIEHIKDINFFLTELIIVLHRMRPTT